MGLWALLFCICPPSVSGMEKFCTGIFGAHLIGADCRISQQEVVGEEVSKKGEVLHQQTSKVTISPLTELFGFWQQCEFYHRLGLALSSWKSHSGETHLWLWLWSFLYCSCGSERSQRAGTERVKQKCRHNFKGAIPEYWDVCRMVVVGMKLQFLWESCWLFSMIWQLPVAQKLGQGPLPLEAEAYTQVAGLWQRTDSVNSLSVLLAKYLLTSKLMVIHLCFWKWKSFAG